MIEDVKKTRLIKIKQAAQYLGKGQQAVRLMVLNGELRCIPGKKLRNPWLFDIRDLDQWIEDNKIEFPLNNP
jgi:hypothetical protein